MNRGLPGLLAGLAGVLALAADARAEGMTFPGARPLGAGGALRGLATGDAGPMLNPSGISLMRAYSVEAGYQYGRTLGSHDARISAVDSTSAFNLGGALYYSYHHATPADGVSQSGHLLGGSLSFPIVDKVYLGTNLKYVRFTDAAEATHSGFTVDGGLTLRLVPQVSVGVAGYNLIDVATAWAPRGYGGGVAVLPFPALVLAFDVVATKVYGDPERDNALSFMGGGEFSFGTTAGLRAGGGRDGLTRNGYATAGFTLISAELGAIDFGFRQDVSGAEKTTIVGVSTRLFVPNM
jgi:hypothetical protein